MCAIKIFTIAYKIYRIGEAFKAQQQAFENSWAHIGKPDDKIYEKKWLDAQRALEKELNEN